MTPLFSISEIRMTPKINIRKTANQNNVKILYPRNNRPHRADGEEGADRQEEIQDESIRTPTVRRRGDEPCQPDTLSRRMPSLILNFRCIIFIILYDI